MIADIDLLSDDVARITVAPPRALSAGQPRTQERCCVNRAQSVRDGNEPIGEGHHYFGVAAVRMSARDGLICAINKITAPARLALSAVSAKKPYADALANFPT